MKLLLIDNNDSFTYNIVNIIRDFNDIKLQVVAYKNIKYQNLKEYNKIIISPGPDHISSYPNLKYVIDFCIKQNVALFGICLGHQFICEYFGAELFCLDEVFHGYKKEINIDVNSLLYKGIPKNINVGLYHSWAINSLNLPDCIVATSFVKNILYSFKHSVYKIYGVQFHPESFMSEFGVQILRNFVDL